MFLCLKLVIDYSVIIQHDVNTQEKKRSLCTIDLIDFRQIFFGMEMGRCLTSANGELGIRVDRRTEIYPSFVNGMNGV